MDVSPLFVYGTLLAPEILELVIGRPVESQPAILKGYACHYVQGATFPGIFRDGASQTEGRVLKNLRGSEIQALDQYEDSFYERLHVNVCSEGDEIDAMAYVVPLVHRGVLSEEKWTWEEFERLHLSDYLRRMRST